MTRIVFMGTPDFAVPTLKALIEHYDVVGVVTQPDRPVGRKRKIQPSPVKIVAQEAGIPILQPHSLRKEPEAVKQLAQWGADVFVVAAFGQILPQNVLDIPPHGSINVHASLLPRWRGAAPIQAAIRAGDKETGVTIMLMDAGLDTGPMLTQKAIEIAADETGQSLHDKLAVLGAELLIETLPGYLSGEINPIPQPEEGVTYAPQIKKEDGLIDWSQSAEAIERQVRAFTPWPGTFTFWNGTQLKIHQGEVVAGHAPEGKIVTIGEQIAVGTGEGLFVLKQIQPAGKKAMSIDAFLRGHQEFIGAQLGNV
ncbi:MAG: methionyl-tRNA formyltransferase [Chloroflexi bacterium]|nr:MAG: methionyl-tRNA formyltransferase [Chloroflexota bacterium]